MGCGESGFGNSSHFSKLGSANLWHCRATEREYNRAITFLLGKQVTGHDSRSVAWYELMKIIYSMGLKAT